MEAKLNPQVRQRIASIYDDKDKIRKEIAVRINREFRSTINTYDSEIDDLREQQDSFVKEAQNITEQLFKTQEKAVIITQTGKNEEVLRKYEGKITKYDKYMGYFNFSDSKFNDGKPFTVAFNCCLHYIAKL